MRSADGRPETAAVLTALIEALEQVQQNIVDEPGSLLIVDNRAVHGRRPFTARYDRTGR